jgi:hypothetical protein
LRKTTTKQVLSYLPAQDVLVLPQYFHSSGRKPLAWVIPAKAGIQEKTVNDPPENAIDESALMPLAEEE